LQTHRRRLKPEKRAERRRGEDTEPELTGSPNCDVEQEDAADRYRDDDENEGGAAHQHIFAEAAAVGA